MPIDMKVAMGGGIKSVQRGTVSMGGVGSSSATVTVSAVNMQKAELRHLGQSSPSNNNLYDFARLSLINATTIQVNVSSANATAATVSWELTEYY